MLVIILVATTAFVVQVKGARGPMPAVMPTATGGNMHMPNQNVAQPGASPMVMQPQQSGGQQMAQQMRRGAQVQQQPQQQPQGTPQQQPQQQPQGAYPGYVQRPPNQQPPQQQQQMMAPGMPNGTAQPRYMNDMGGMYAPADGSGMQQAQQPQQQPPQQQQMMFPTMSQHPQQMMGQPGPTMVPHMRPMAPHQHQQQQVQQPQQPNMQPQNVQVRSRAIVMTLVVMVGRGSKEV